MKKPIIRYLMPAFNEEGYIAESINSILKSEESNIKLLIADNCSTDSTLSICKKLAKADSRIEIIEQRSNVGPINNFTHLASNASGEYIQFVGAHDIVDSNYTDKMINIIKKQEKNPAYIIPECWMLGKDIKYIEEKTYDTRSNHRSLLFMSEFRIRRYLAGVKYWPVNWFNALIREDIFNQAYKSVNDIGCLNSDHFFISALLWYDKPFYASHIKYNFRVMHPHLRESYNKRMGGCGNGEITGHYRDRLYWSITYLYHFGRLLINEEKCSSKEAKKWLFVAAETLSKFHTKKEMVRTQLYEIIELMNLTQTPN